MTRHGSNRKAKPFDIEVGAYLKAKRNQAQVTQEQVAEHMGVSFQQIQKYEKGTNRISLSSFVKYCEAVKVTPNRAIKNVLDAFGEKNENV